MTLLSLLGRIMRYFLLRPETLFLLCISLALWSYFFHTDEVKTIVKSSRDAVKMVKGKVAEMMQNERFGGLDVLDAEFSKTWEFKSNNVAVYSIQGRRDHMEDRFEVLTDIVNKTHPSIFGVFDGHGGEVSVPCSFRRKNKDSMVSTDRSPFTTIFPERSCGDQGVQGCRGAKGSCGGCTKWFKAYFQTVSLNALYVKREVEQVKPNLSFLRI